MATQTGEQLTDDEEDVNCFHRQTEIPKLAILSVRSMTHIVGRALSPGTFCTFTAKLESGFHDNLGSETASCTVGAEGMSELCSGTLSCPEAYHISQY